MNSLVPHLIDHKNIWMKLKKSHPNSNLYHFACTKDKTKRNIMKELSRLKSFFILLVLPLLSTGISMGRGVPISTPVRDQLLQGPCYIFATVAALESKAIQSGLSNVDLYEWNLYSKQVIGSRTGSGHVMVTSLLNHAQTNGVYDITGVQMPSLNDLPNLNDPLVPGIADFSSCISNLNSSYYAQVPEGNCLDDDDKTFELAPFSGYKYTFNKTGAGYILDTDPNPFEMRNLLNQGNGLIAFFDQWDNTSTSHAVFIYGYNGSDWKYKDSWPGNPGNKQTALDITKCTRFYYLTGGVTSNMPATCQGTISGSGTVTGNTTYTLTGGNYTNINWENIIGNLSVVSESGNSITVSPSNCGISTATIPVTYQDNGSQCNTSKTVTVSSSSQNPASISVLSANWNNGQTCPNTTLELEVVDNNNPVYPQTSYDWQISGATILSGNGTPTLMVRTSNSPGTTFLTFKVRAKYSTCAYSAWTNLNGTSSSTNCAGGGGGAMSAVSIFPNPSTSAKVQLKLNQLNKYDQNKTYSVVIFNSVGAEVKKSILKNTTSITEISGLQRGIHYFKIYDENNKLIETQRVMINKQ